MLVTLDGQNRVTLGKFLSDIRTKLFDVRVVGGNIVLEPMEAIPVKEVWLYKNSQALKSVKKGLKDAQTGKIREFDPDKE